MTIIIAGLIIALIVVAGFAFTVLEAMAEYERQKQIEEAKQTAMRHIAEEAWRARQAMLGAVSRGWHR